MFLHVLKTGCRVESLQLASLPKIERALALYMVVSWRIARLLHQPKGADQPSLSKLLGVKLNVPIHSGVSQRVMSSASVSKSGRLPACLVQLLNDRRSTGAVTDRRKIAS